MGAAGLPARTTAAGPLGAIVSAVIPAIEEEEAIGPVVRDVLATGIAEVIVVDGGSRDRTVARAQAAGATVVVEPRRGYGCAVQAGVRVARPDATILVFLDGDGSDRPDRIPDLVRPIVAGTADFVHGTRVKGARESGSLSPQQRVAGRLAGLLLRAAYGARFTDMSPFRAIRRQVLEDLGMREESYGWNLEMLMRVSAARLRCEEVAVGQRRRRGGVSKVSGDIRATVRAGWVISATFLRLARKLSARQER